MPRAVAVPEPVEVAGDRFCAMERLSNVHAVMVVCAWVSGTASRDPQPRVRRIIFFI